jgi:hypothetical protein
MKSSQLEAGLIHSTHLIAELFASSTELALVSTPNQDKNTNTFWVQCQHFIVQKEQQELHQSLKLSCLSSKICLRV